MKFSQSKRIVLTAIMFSVLLLIISCTVTKEQDDVGKYCVVTPTEKELSEIVPRLDYIFSMFHDDYNASSDNIYEYLFHNNWLDYVYPHYDEEVKKYIAEPMRINELTGHMFWKESCIPENDPLGKFPKIRDEVYDENGNISEGLVYELREKENLCWQDVVIGHNKFSGEYIDWLVEGVWNGKADHDTFMIFEDGTRLYYHDGFYYTPESVGGRGGGIFYYPIIDSITPLEDGKYEIVYQLYNDIDIKISENKAIIGMKENSDGFRFWSIFSIDYNYTGDKFNY